MTVWLIQGALFAFLIPVFGQRAWRMGLLGMWAMRPCPPSLDTQWRSTEFKVVCCDHNRCPDRPLISRKYLTQPWRCPQCGQWWIAHRPNKQWIATPPLEWVMTSTQVGDTFIIESDLS